MKLKNDILKFSTGRELYENHGIIGINSTLGIFEGYDDDVYDDVWLKEEKIELADYMISLWNKYKKREIK